jgi:hypothetical protein
MKDEHQRVDAGAVTHPTGERFNPPHNVATRFLILDSGFWILNSYCLF